MDIRHEANGTGGRFIAGEGGAELIYRAAGNLLVFEHTYVSPALRGRGLAEALVEAGVALARERGVRVVPACSYVDALFRRRPADFADVAAPPARG